MSKKNKETVEKVYHKKLIKRRKPNRSIAGDIALYIFLALVAFVMFFPIIFAVSNALKPLDELFRFPPKILAQNPTLPLTTSRICLLPWVNPGLPSQDICSIQYS